MEARGIEFDPNLVVPGDFHESGGVLAVNQLLEAGQRFTAIFASNDQLAYGARLGLYRRGIRGPDDMSIIGFDDLPGSLYTTPPLTTVRQPMFEIGKCIGEALLKMIHGEDASLDVPQLKLIVRESARRLS